mmetsp:Transcript_9153/g.26742  ORF Transcript_9153/g.26742 Transcript_9153/m.26742 type:complete len:436 (+) Transcript_9153:25-1332(+)
MFSALHDVTLIRIPEQNQAKGNNPVPGKKGEHTHARTSTYLHATRHAHEHMKEWANSRGPCALSSWITFTRKKKEMPEARKALRRLGGGLGGRLLGGGLGGRLLGGGFDGRLLVGGLGGRLLGRGVLAALGLALRREALLVDAERVLLKGAPRYRPLLHLGGVDALEPVQEAGALLGAEQVHRHGLRVAPAGAVTSEVVGEHEVRGERLALALGGLVRVLRLVVHVGVRRVQLARHDLGGAHEHHGQLLEGLGGGGLAEVRREGPEQVDALLRRQGLRGLAHGRPERLARRLQAQPLPEVRQHEVGAGAIGGHVRRDERAEEAAQVRAEHAAHLHEHRVRLERGVDPAVHERVLVEARRQGHALHLGGETQRDELAVRLVHGVLQRELVHHGLVGVGLRRGRRLLARLHHVDGVLVVLRGGDLGDVHLLAVERRR